MGATFHGTVADLLGKKALAYKTNPYAAIRWERDQPVWNVVVDVNEEGEIYGQPNDRGFCDYLGRCEF